VGDRSWKGSQANCHTDTEVVAYRQYGVYEFIPMKVRLGADQVADVFPVKILSGKHMSSRPHRGFADTVGNLDDWPPCTAIQEKIIVKCRNYLDIG
jgi:hypothetical protein